METIADSASACRILNDPQQLAKLKIFIRRISRDDGAANGMLCQPRRGVLVKLQIMFRALHASPFIIYALFHRCRMRGYEILDAASTFLDLNDHAERARRHFSSL